MAKPLSHPTRYLLILFIIIYIIFFTAQLFLHYYSFGSRAQDLGNMDQAIWNTLHGRPFHQTNQPGASNRLSLHVEPILLPISLLYLIYSGPETLFVLQTIAVALGAVPVFALARLKLNSDGLALVLALVYLMFPAIQAATLLDFHAVTMAPTFLLAAFYFLEIRRNGWFALFAGLAMACKEEIGLMVMMMGFYALLIQHRPRVGLTTVVLSGSWAFMAVFVIPPMFAGTDNIHWGRYSHLGDGPLDIVLNFLTRPGLVLGHLQAVNALEYLRLLLEPTAYLALFSPVTLLLALPSLGINLLSDFPPMQRVNSLIYAAPLVPAVIISSILGVAYLRRFAEKILDHAHESGSAPRTPRFMSTLDLLLGGLILAASLVYHLQYGYLPGGGQYRGWETVTDHQRRAGRIIDQVPPGAALSAHDRLNPHVSQRETLYIFDRLEEADHIILDVTEDSWPLHPVELRHRVDQLLANGFGIVDAYDGYLLLARTPDPLPTALPDEFFDFARVSRPDTFRPRFPVEVTFDDKLQLIGYDIGLGAHEKFLPVVTLYWRALVPLEQNYTLWPFFIDRQGRVIEEPRDRPLVAPLWYPTSHWSPGEIIITRTLPWELAPHPGDQFTLAVGVAAGGDWSDPLRRLPLTRTEPGLYAFENSTWTRLNTFARTGRKDYEPVAPTATQPSQPRQVQFWNLIELQGVDMPMTSLKAGQALPFTLYWQAEAPLTIDLTTFAHLLDSQGRLAAQLDWTPQDSLGYLPTTAWQPGRSVADRQTMPLLPDHLPPGQYRLIAGWYYPVTGDRLPLTATDRPGQHGDAVELGLITIE